jgi:glycosyltransferase involved in cell wall biosynthesis
MATEISLSVCIITYNHADYIEQAVLSVISQKTSFNFEILIGEDCSTDQTADILRRLQVRYPGRLSVIYRDKNIGGPRNFEETLNACRGEFVAFLEGDDFWTYDDKLETQVAYLKQHPRASFCYHRVRSLNLTGLPEHIFPPENPPAETTFQFVFQEYNPIHITSIVARRSQLDGLHEWRKDLQVGDWPIALFLTTVGYGGYISAEMSRYRIHSEGLWTRLPDRIRLIYIYQMYLRISNRLSQQERILIDNRIARDSEWLTAEMAAHPKETCQIVRKLEDIELSTFLLSCTLKKVRQQNNQKALSDDVTPRGKPAQSRFIRFLGNLRQWLK